MNRAGMNDCPSPYLQMSFETTCTFLTKAAIEGAHDTIQVEIYLKFLEIDGS